MKFSTPISIKEIAEQFNCELIGNADLEATGINEIHKVEKGDITFVDLDKYYDKSINSAASVIIIDKRAEFPEGKALLLCENPFEVYNQIAKEHRPFEPLNSMVSDSAVIHPSSVLEPNVVVGNHVRIGKNCYIQANVFIGEYSVIGDNVNIQAGTVIGTDAFYHKKSEKGFEKWRSVGRVVIENDVEIGACCTINKGVSGDTIIGEGTKLDCQIHIAHGVVVGKKCLFAAQVGIGGKTIIGDEVILYGQVGIIHNLVIGDNIIVLAGAGVNKNLESGKVYFGAPAAEARTKYKELAALKMLPDFMRENRK
jgi:UDP-3-O-[3-hydroxymyristoyl] glucosamine N-acyltransferase